MTTKKFAPILRYLVEVNGVAYTHPDCIGFTAGVEAWADTALQFYLYRNARAHAAKYVGAKVIKLRISAKQEPFASQRKKSK